MPREWTETAPMLKWHISWNFRPFATKGRSYNFADRKTQFSYTESRHRKDLGFAIGRLGADVFKFQRQMISSLEPITSQ